MTSMPASRRARAITFAPRSCPSRPGFATSTRIFCSVGMLFGMNQRGSTRNALGYNRDRKIDQFDGECLSELAASFVSSAVSDFSPLHRLNIQTAPQVPAGDAAIGFPRSGDLFHLHRIGQLAFMVMLFHCHLDSEVAGRQYVLPLQCEYQKHVRGPDADAFDLGQMFYDFFISHLRQVS